MDERLRFVARLLEGENMAALCQEFGISRKTGYKIFDRYKNAVKVDSAPRSPTSLALRASFVETASAVLGGSPGGRRYAAT